jgi:hypothetical protein
VEGEDENWVTVTKRQSVKPGEVLGVTVGEHEIALYNVMGASTRLITSALTLTHS